MVLDASGTVTPTPGVLAGVSYNVGGIANVGTAGTAITNVMGAFTDIGVIQFAASDYPNLSGTPINNAGVYVNTNMGDNITLTVGEILVTAIGRTLKSLALNMFDIVNTEQESPVEIRTITTEEYADYKARELEDKFQRLVTKWKGEVMNTSSITTMVINNPTYQEIFGMGPDAIPFILRQIESEGDDPDHWGWALSRITGEDPVPKSAAGDTVKIAKAWLSWGRSQYVR
jgi:hypothetical protein